jgi:hypothetical protein
VRPKVIAAILGIVLVLGGVGAMTYGITGLSAVGGRCSGDECLDNPSVLGLPLGIIALVFGIIIAAWALGSIRADRQTTSPLNAFGFMTGLGAVFAAMGILFLAAGRSGTADDGDTLLFVGALFGVMGLCFIGVDLLRFRGELRKDRLRTSGLRGTAKVIDVRDTNVTVNNSPLVNLGLEVTIPGQSPFQTRKRVVISRLNVGAMSPGATIPVLADPAKPTSIVLDWDSGTTAPSTDGLTLLRNARTGWFPQGTATMFGGGGAANAQMLRNVSAALERAAERAEHGGGGATLVPGGTTVIDGGTTVMVNGRQVPASEAGAMLAGFPAALAAAFSGAQVTSAAGSMGTGVAPGGSPTPLPGSPTPPAMPSAVPAGVPPAPSSATPLGSTVGGMDVSMPGAAPIDDGLPARVSLDTIQDTGVDLGGNRLYAFDLTVSVAGRRPYQVRHAAAVPSALVGRLMRGASFPAHIDPARPDQLSIAWDR